MLCRDGIDQLEIRLYGGNSFSALLNRSIEKATSAALPVQVIDGAWENQRVTYDPIAASLKKSADDAAALGFLDRSPDLTNIYNLTFLNKVLRERQLTEVKGLG